MAKTLFSQCTAVCKIDSQWEHAVYRRELCDDLDGWAGCGRGPRRRGYLYMYMELIHFVVQQKLTQHCKTTILQIFLKKKNFYSL